MQACGFYTFEISPLSPQMMVTSFWSVSKTKSVLSNLNENTMSWFRASVYVINKENFDFAICFIAAICINY